MEHTMLRYRDQSGFSLPVLAHPLTDSAVRLSLPTPKEMQAVKSLKAAVQLILQPNWSPFLSLGQHHLLLLSSRHPIINDIWEILRGTRQRTRILMPAHTTIHRQSAVEIVHLLNSRSQPEAEWISGINSAWTQQAPSAQ